jgi:hypothetical protein
VSAGHKNVFLRPDKSIPEIIRNKTGIWFCIQSQETPFITTFEVKGNRVVINGIEYKVIQKIIV